MRERGWKEEGRIRKRETMRLEGRGWVSSLGGAGQG